MPHGPHPRDRIDGIFGQGAEQMRQTPVRMAQDSFCWSFISRDDDEAMEMEESEELTGHANTAYPSFL